MFGKHVGSLMSIVCESSAMFACVYTRIARSTHLHAYTWQSVVTISCLPQLMSILIISWDEEIECGASEVCHTGWPAVGPAVIRLQLQGSVAMPAFICMLWIWTENLTLALRAFCPYPHSPTLDSFRYNSFHWRSKNHAFFCPLSVSEFSWGLYRE